MNIRRATLILSAAFAFLTGASSRRGSLERLPDLLGAEATDILLMSDSFARRYVRFAAVRPARSHAKITDHGSSELSIRI